MGVLLTPFVYIYRGVQTRLEFQCKYILPYTVFFRLLSSRNPLVPFPMNVKDN